MIKIAADFIAHVLTELINDSFREGIFPSYLKTAVVKPIYKKNDASKIDNYRAISLLSVFSKIYEKAFHYRLLRHVSDNKILTDNQYGFRPFVSTQHASVELTNYVLRNLDIKKKVVGIYFDFTRAFDTVSHNLLLNKLRAYNIEGQALSWLASYLRDRSQKVVLRTNTEEYHSELLKVKAGVPQGSVLGPLLFIIFLNDIDKKLDSDFIALFADDTSIVLSADNTTQLSAKASNCVSRMQQYCTKNSLVLNVNKTEVISFSAIERQCSLLVRYNGTSLKNSQLVRFLGIQLDPNLGWHSHIEKVVKTLSTQCFVFWRLRGCVSEQVMLSYYYAFVYSTLSYGILCWGNARNINDVLIIQKRIVRTISFMQQRESCRTVFPKLGILTVISIYILQSVIYIKNNISKFHKVSDCKSYNLRYGDTLHLPKHGLSLTASGSYILPIKLYNQLPLSIKCISNINLFKKRVKCLLTNHAFYSVNEFLQCRFVNEC